MHQRCKLVKDRRGRKDGVSCRRIELVVEEEGYREQAALRQSAGTPASRSTGGNGDEIYSCDIVVDRRGCCERVWAGVRRGAWFCA